MIDPPMTIENARAILSADTNEGQSLFPRELVRAAQQRLLEEMTPEARPYARESIEALNACEDMELAHPILATYRLTRKRRGQFEMAIGEALLTANHETPLETYREQADKLRELIAMVETIRNLEAEQGELIAEYNATRGRGVAANDRVTEIMARRQMPKSLEALQAMLSQVKEASDNGLV